MGDGRNGKSRVHYRGYFYPAPVTGENVVTKCGIKRRWQKTTDVREAVDCRNCRAILKLREDYDRDMPPMRADIN